MPYEALPVPLRCSRRELRLRLSAAAPSEILVGQFPVPARDQLASLLYELQKGDLYLRELIEILIYTHLIFRKCVAQLMQGS